MSADLEVFIPNLRCWPNVTSFNRQKKLSHLRLGVTACDGVVDLLDEIKREIKTKEPVLFVLDRDYFFEKNSMKCRSFYQRLLAEVWVPTL
jgi:hypothetical protein